MDYCSYELSSINTPQLHSFTQHINTTNDGKLAGNHGLRTSLTTDKTKLLEIHCLFYSFMYLNFKSYRLSNPLLYFDLYCRISASEIVVYKQFILKLPILKLSMLYG